MPVECEFFECEIEAMDGITEHNTITSKQDESTFIIFFSTKERVEKNYFRLACRNDELPDKVYSQPFTLEITINCQDANAYRVYENNDFSLRPKQFSGVNNIRTYNMYTGQLFMTPDPSCTFKTCILL